MSERTFWYTIKRYADAKELDDYKDKPRPPNDPYRKFIDVIKTSDDTREEQNTRFANFEEDLGCSGRRKEAKSNCG
jgi:hypothetical protein